MENIETGSFNGQTQEGTLGIRGGNIIDESLSSWVHNRERRSLQFVSQHDRITKRRDHHNIAAHAGGSEAERLFNKHEHQVYNRRNRRRARLEARGEMFDSDFLQGDPCSNSPSSIEMAHENDPSIINWNPEIPETMYIETQSGEQSYLIESAISLVFGQQNMEDNFFDYIVTPNKRRDRKFTYQSKKVVKRRDHHNISDVKYLGYHNEKEHNRHVRKQRWKKEERFLIQDGITNKNDRNDSTTIKNKVLPRVLHTKPVVYQTQTPTPTHLYRKTTIYQEPIGWGLRSEAERIKKERYFGQKRW